MRKSFLRSFVLALLTCGSHVIHAIALERVNPEIQISKTIPVVGNEIELAVNFSEHDTTAPAEAVVTLTHEGKELLREEVVVRSGRYALKWTPEELGFYTATFDFGSESGLGKISHEFPVVWRELYFTVWGVLWPEQIRQVKFLLSHAAISGETNKAPFDETIPMLKARGSKLLRVTSGTTAISDGPVTDEQVDQLVEAWSRPMKNGFDGIMMDEMGEYPIPSRLAVVDGVNKALLKLRQQNSDTIIMPWVGGQLSREEAAGFRMAECMIMLEAYPNMFTRVWGAGDGKHYIDVRVRNARANDLLWQYSKKAGSIIALGINVDGAHEEPIVPEAEEWVRYIKKSAPEMPGIGFYGLPRAAAIETLEALDRLCLEYFVKPVVDIRQIHFSDFSPTVGESVDVLIGLNNLGGMDAQRVKLNIYAAEVGTGKKNLIGELEIDKIGCGVKTLVKKDKDNFSIIERQEFNGNSYSLFLNETPIWLGRTTAKVTWEPKQSASYSIIAEIQPSDQYTTLDGVAERFVVVR